MAPWFPTVVVASLLLAAEASHLRPRQPKAANMVPKYASFPRHIKRQAFSNTTTTERPQITPVPVPPVTPLDPDSATTTTATQDSGPLGNLPAGVSLPTEVSSLLENGGATPSNSDAAAAAVSASAAAAASASASGEQPPPTPPPIIPVDPSLSVSLPVSVPVSVSVSVPLPGDASASAGDGSQTPVGVVPPVVNSVISVVTGAGGEVTSLTVPAGVPVVAPPVSEVTLPDGSVASITVPPVVVVPTPTVALPVSDVTLPDGSVASVTMPAVVPPVVSAVTGADGVVSSITVPAVIPPVASVVTGADGVVSSLTVPAVVAPIASVVTGADGVVSSITVPAVIPPVASVVTGADGVVSSLTVPAVVAPIASVVTGADGVVSSVTVPAVIAPIASVVTGADGVVSSVTVPAVVAPIVSAVTGADGVVSSLTLPPVVVPTPSVTLGGPGDVSVVNSILSSVLGDASVTAPAVINSILSDISASINPAGPITSEISLPPISTTLPNGVVTTLPGTTVPTVLPALASLSGSTETATPAIIASQSAGLSQSLSALTDSLSAAAASASAALASLSASEAGATATATGPSQSVSASPADVSASGASATEGTATTPTPEGIAPLFTQNGPTSIAPTGTDSLTAQYTNSVIVADQPSSTATLATSDFGIPTTLPQVIAPPNSGGVLPVQPPGTEMIQIAFTRPLNYPFVIQHVPAIEQIYNYLPVGVAYGLSMELGNITMHSLQPYDTTATQGFITTVAYAYIPSDLVDLMVLQVSNPAARFHHYPPESSPVFQLIKYVNTAFPVRAPASVSGGPGSAAPGAPNASPSTILNVVDPLNNGSGSSSTVNPMSIGIGFAVVGGAALYGAAMFLVARRYRKRRSVHGRSPSIIDTASMAHSHPEMVGGAGAALMGGARGYSGEQDTAYYGTSGRNSRGSGRTGSSRGRDISAPVMAENSLGWN